jgi:hypothetical protein
MKEYLEPVILITYFTEDVVTTSSGSDKTDVIEDSGWTNWVHF